MMRLANGNWSDSVHQAYVTYRAEGGGLPFFVWHQRMAPAHRLCSLCDAPGDVVRVP